MTVIPLKTKSLFSLKNEDKGQSYKILTQFFSGFARSVTLHGEKFFEVLQIPQNFTDLHMSGFFFRSRIPNQKNKSQKKNKTIKNSSIQFMLNNFNLFQSKKVMKIILTNQNTFENYQKKHDLGELQKEKKISKYITSNFFNNTWNQTFEISNFFQN